MKFRTCEGNGGCWQAAGATRRVSWSTCSLSTGKRRRMRSTWRGVLAVVRVGRTEFGGRRGLFKRVDDRRQRFLQHGSFGGCLTAFVQVSPFHEQGSVCLEHLSNAGEYRR